jgi:hypothetical protein
MKDSAHGAGQEQGADLGRDSAELEALAARYLDLWQDQVSAMAADSDLAAAFQSLFGPSGWAAMAGASPLAAWQAMMAQFTNVAQTAAGTPAERTSHDPARGQRRGANGPTAGASAAAAAPDGGDAGLDELARRLAALEARLAALEGGERPAKPRRNGGKSPAKPRRKRS